MLSFADGHVKGSKNLPMSDLIDTETGLLKTKALLQNGKVSCITFCKQYLHVK